jgi:DNA methylase
VHNQLIFGNPLLEMAKLPNGSVDLIYLPAEIGIDDRHPPRVPTQLSLFGRDHGFAHSPSVQESGNGGLNQQLSFLTACIKESQRLLTRSGNLYVHCSPDTQQHLRKVLNEAFSEERFRNEIIWRRWPTPRGGVERPFAHVHDVLLLYANSEESTAHATYLPERAIDSAHYRFVDRETGRRYALSDCSSPRPAKVENRYSWRGHLKTWRWSREHMEDLERHGRLVHTRSGFPRQKRYLDERKGSLATSIWDDIPGTPTGRDKPEALLNRIITASTNPGDVVLVPNCEQGMTLVAAERQGRRWIAIDSNHAHMAATRARLQREFGPDVRRSYDAVGFPRCLDDVNSLAQSDIPGFRYWFLGEVGAEPTAELRSSDRGYDGRIVFRDGDVERLVACVVRIGKVTRATLDEAESILKRVGADAVMLLSLQTPPREIRAAMVVGSTVRLSRGRMPRLHLVTAQDLFSKRLELRVRPWLLRSANVGGDISARSGRRKNA